MRNLIRPIDLLLAAALVAALMLPSRVPAQEVATTPPAVEANAPAPSAVHPKFYLELDQADLQAISQAINELPKRVADPLILKLNGQLQAQTQIVAAKAKAGAEAQPEEPKKGKKR